MAKVTEIVKQETKLMVTIEAEILIEGQDYHGSLKDSIECVEEAVEKLREQGSATGKIKIVGDATWEI